MSQCSKHPANIILLAFVKPACIVIADGGRRPRENALLKATWGVHSRGEIWRTRSLFFTTMLHWLSIALGYVVEAKSEQARHQMQGIRSRFIKWLEGVPAFPNQKWERKLKEQEWKQNRKQKDIGSVKAPMHESSYYFINNGWSDSDWIGQNQ